MRPDEPGSRERQQQAGPPRRPGRGGGSRRVARRPGGTRLAPTAVRSGDVAHLGGYAPEQQVRGIGARDQQKEADDHGRASAGPGPRPPNNADWKSRTIARRSRTDSGNAAPSAACAADRSAWACCDRHPGLQAADDIRFGSAGLVSRVERRGRPARAGRPSMNDVNVAGITPTTVAGAPSNRTGEIHDIGPPLEHVLPRLVTDDQHGAARLVRSRESVIARPRAGTMPSTPKNPPVTNCPASAFRLRARRDVEPRGRGPPPGPRSSGYERAIPGRRNRPRPQVTGASFCATFSRTRLPLVGVGQWTEVHGVHDREDHAVGGDAQRERRDHREGETWSAAERPEGSRRETRRTYEGSPGAFVCLDAGNGNPARAAPASLDSGRAALARPSSSRTSSVGARRRGTMCLAPAPGAMEPGCRRRVRPS